MCGERIFAADHLQQYNHGVGSVSATCQAGSGYSWGFSFLLTFVTSVLNLVFVILMYLIATEARRHGEWTKDVGEFKDAVTMVTLAQQQYGDKIGDWSSSTLQKEIVGGQVGMTFSDTQLLTKRKNGLSSAEREFGDPRAGDWGGEVYVSDQR